MVRFLTGLSWSQPVASKAHALGMGLDDVQALVESRDAQVEHTRLHHYAYSRDGFGWSWILDPDGSLASSQSILRQGHQFVMS